MEKDPEIFIENFKQWLEQDCKPSQQKRIMIIGKNGYLSGKANEVKLEIAQFNSSKNFDKIFTEFCDDGGLIINAYDNMLAVEVASGVLRIPSSHVIKV